MGGCSQQVLEWTQEPWSVQEGSSMAHLLAYQRVGWHFEVFFYHRELEEEEEELVIAR